MQRMVEQLPLVEDTVQHTVLSRCFYNTGRIRLPFIKKIKDTIKKYQRMSESMMSHVCVREKEHQHREEMKGQISNIRPAESPALKI